jgi:hypothetical protein
VEVPDCETLAPVEIATVAFPKRVAEEYVTVLTVIAVPAATVAGWLSVIAVLEIETIVVPEGIPVPVMIAPLELPVVRVTAVEPSELVMLVTEATLSVVLAAVLVPATSGRVTIAR